MLMAFVAVLAASQVAAGQATKLQTVTLSEAIMARIPVAYRAEAKELIRASEDDQQRLTALSDEQLIGKVFDSLAGEEPEGIGFLLARLEREPSSNLRSQIIRSMWGYWKSHPEQQNILEHYLVSDPDAGVSLE